MTSGSNSGSLYCSSNGSGAIVGAGYGSYSELLMNIDASRSSSLYGSSTTVTPLSLSSKYYIKY